MNHLLLQIKKRRLALGLKQSDMLLRVGISRQQYQRLEAKGNPRLDTLELIARGLNSELLLVPKEKLNVILAAIEQDDQPEALTSASESLSNDPWRGLLGDEQ